MNILITGCAGFIGFHLSNRISKNPKFNLFGVDNINNYYDIDLKKSRLKLLIKKKNFQFKKLDIKKKNLLINFCKKNKIKFIVHLAAQAGVRYSISNPETYFENNILGFFNILEVSRVLKIKHLVYASTSSVYGNLKTYPLNEEMNTDKPLSFYAASKKSNEIMSYSYSNIYNIPITALRFFTVYGPFGRPDMALAKFVNSIISNKKINLFNNGNHVRDFTYIDKITSSIEKLILKPPKHKVPHEIFNIASGKPVKLKYFLKTIEKNLGKSAKVRSLNLQKGDVLKTHADVNKLQNKIKGKISTNLEKGIENFITWYKNYYKIK